MPVFGQDHLRTREYERRRINPPERKLDTGFPERSCSNKQMSLDAGRWRRQQIAEPPHGLDDIDVQLLADASDEYFDGVGVAVEVLIVEMLDQFGARHHAPGVVHQIG